MSFHLHLRATASGQVPEDFSSLLDFMLTAWEALQEEYAAGVAESIGKDFGNVHELYTAGTDHDDASPANLAIFGGRPVHPPTKERPPLVVLHPVDVRRTAEFLRTLSFDERWRVAGTRLSAPYAGWEDKTAARTIYLGYHSDLSTFYERAAHAGQAVIKAFWY